MTTKEFNLSEKRKEVIGDDDEFIEYDYSERDVKEFIRRDTQLIKDFNDGKMTYNFMMNERAKLAGNKLT